MSRKQSRCLAAHLLPARSNPCLPLSLSPSSQIEAAIVSCSEQILAFINKSLAEEQLPPLSEAQQQQLKSQLEQLANKSSPVRTLMCK